MTAITKTRVFLVDDHPVVRAGMRQVLELDDRISVVGEADSGEEVLEQLSRCPTDVVLMDICLPDMDGIEATRQLRARHADLKIMILSAFGDEYLAEAIEAGANGYILKTTAQEELTRAVIQTASGQGPLDPTLTPRLFDRMAELSRSAQSQELSSRQQEILRLIADGVPSREIAARLSMSQATMSRQLRQVFDLLGVDDRAHAIAEAYRKNLL